MHGQTIGRNSLNLDGVFNYSNTVREESEAKYIEVRKDRHVIQMWLLPLVPSCRIPEE